MIAALAKAARALDDPEYLAAAEKAAAFVLDNLRGPDGRLLHRYRGGEAGIRATLDDYAFTLCALIEVYEASFSPKYLEFATELSRDLFARYWDCTHGGFFFTPDDTDVPIRQKTVYDGAVPSGNSVAMYALFALGRMTANLELEETANRIQHVFADAVQKTPVAWFTRDIVAVGERATPYVCTNYACDIPTTDPDEMLRLLGSRERPPEPIV